MSLILVGEDLVMVEGAVDKEGAVVAVDEVVEVMANPVRNLTMVLTSLTLLDSSWMRNGLV